MTRLLHRVREGVEEADNAMEGKTKRKRRDKGSVDRVYGKSTRERGKNGVYCCVLTSHSDVGIVISFNAQDRPHIH